MSEASVRSDYNRRRDAQREAAAAKETLINRAEAINTSTDWRNTSNEMRVLMEQWKQIGYAGRELNDQLWDRFRNARQVFYDRRSAHNAHVGEGQANAASRKRELISEAHRVAANAERDWKGAGVRMRELMGEWKAAGFSGRENEDRLWSEFNSIRQAFYQRRERAFNSRKMEWARNAQLKGSLVTQAQAISSSYDYSPAQRQRMKSLAAQWKAIGPASREDDDRLWHMFRSAQDAYWQECSRDFERRKVERQQRMRDAYYRKQETVRKLENNIAKLRSRLCTTTNYAKQMQIQGWISENEAQIRELQRQIYDIQSKI